MGYDKEKQDLRNEKHANSPKVGDYWQEMLCPICVVVSFKNGIVAFIRKKNQTLISWSWDLYSVEYLRVEDFKKMLKYDSRDGYLCDVEPRRHKWIATLLKERNNKK